MSLSAVVNEMIRCEKTGERYPVTLGAERVTIAPDVSVVTDTAALRHCECLANSGWCTCSREFALRDVPDKPTNEKELWQRFYLNGAWQNNLQAFGASFGSAPDMHRRAIWA